MFDKNTVCRTCMINIGDKGENSPYRCNIFETEGLCDKLIQCINLELQPHDEYPPNVCNDCCICIFAYYDFLSLCRQSMKEFKKLLKKEQQVVKNIAPNILQAIDNTGNEIEIKTQEERNETFLEQEIIMYGHPIVTLQRGEDPLSDNCERIIKEAVLMAIEETKLDGVTYEHDYAHSMGKPLVFNKLECENQFLKNEFGDVEMNEAYANIQRIIGSVEEDVTEMKCESSIGSNCSVAATYDCLTTENAISVEISDIDREDINLNNKQIQCNNKEVETREEQIVEVASKNNSVKRTKVLRKMYCCDLCPKKFKTEKLLTTHKRKHQGIRKHSCPHENCTETFDTMYDVHIHLKEHYSSEENSYKCDKCDKEYLSINDLRNHKGAEHKRRRPVRKYICETCGATYASSINLKAHQYLHVDPSLWPYKCNIKDCSKSFRTKKDYDTHKNRHDGIKPYACTMCEKRFCSHANLHVHMNHHTQAKSWTCQFCSKVFYTPGNLRQHIEKSHQNNPKTLIQCRFCNKLLPSYSSRKYHERKHTGEKPPTAPQTCKICNKILATASSMKCHEMKHMGGKPYACEICGVRFRYKKNISRHHKNSQCGKSRNIKKLENIPMNDIEEDIETFVINEEHDVESDII